jgi:hypothetical protein
LQELRSNSAILECGAPGRVRECGARALTPELRDPRWRTGGVARIRMTWLALRALRVLVLIERGEEAGDAGVMVTVEGRGVGRQGSEHKKTDE